MKILFSLTFLIINLSLYSQATDWDLSTPGQITTSNKLGIGTTSSIAKLNINATGVSGGENLIWMTVSDASPDYLRLANSTGATGQFIPLIVGHHETDNRVSFQIIGQTSVGMDSGNQPLIGFSARADNNYVNNRPLFQWSNFTSHKMTILANGDVGIGTVTPNAKVDVQVEAGSSEIMMDFGVKDAANDYLRIRNATSATSQFIPSIYGYHTSDNRQALYLIGGISASNDNGGQPITVFDSRIGTAPVANRPLFGWDSYGNRKMILTADGSLGIGTTSPDEKLTVKGTIHTEEVRVDLSVPGPDYVFEEDYDLRSLEETEAYIKANKHLPEVPSAKEMEDNGVQLGEMNMLLLKKIEELTLHQIEMMKIIKSQQERLEQLESDQ